MQRTNTPLAIGCGVILLIVGVVPWGMRLASKAMPAYALVLPTLCLCGAIILFASARRAIRESPAPPPPPPSQPPFADLGTSVGRCTTCQRPVYAIPGPALMRLVMGNEDDKVRANAMWCLSCDTLHCMGCASDSHQLCSQCGGALGDMHHPRGRPPS